MIVSDNLLRANSTNVVTLVVSKRLFSLFFSSQEHSLFFILIIAGYVQVVNHLLSDRDNQGFSLQPRSK